MNVKASGNFCFILLKVMGIKTMSLLPVVFSLLFILGFFSGCSDDDPTPGCFQESRPRAIVEIVTDVPGVVSFECINNYIIDPDIRLDNNPIGILFPCNLEEQFKEEGLRVIFSGYIYESFDLEDICADFFEITEMRFDDQSVVPTSGVLPR